MGGSRDGLPIYELGLRICCLGMDTLTKWAEACVAKAEEVAWKMRAVGVKNVLLNPFATTVYFKQPSKRLMDKYHLAPDGENCHLIVGVHTLSEFGGYGTVDRFMDEFLAELREADGL